MKCSMNLWWCIHCALFWFLVPFSNLPLSSAATVLAFRPPFLNTTSYGPSLHPPGAILILRHRFLRVKPSCPPSDLTFAPILAPSWIDFPCIIHYSNFYRPIQPWIEKYREYMKSNNLLIVLPDSLTLPKKMKLFLSLSTSARKKFSIFTALKTNIFFDCSKNQLFLIKYPRKREEL